MQDWKLRIYGPLGDFKREVSKDDSYIRSAGLRMQLTPNGDCLEATFEARGRGIDLLPLDCVQIIYGGVPIFYGEVRQGGNRRDMRGEKVVLRSLAKRFYEVVLPPGFSTPQQPAHKTITAAIGATYQSGQFGKPAAFAAPGNYPDLGFDCRPITNANQQTLGALLDQIVQDGAGLGAVLKWGVGPDRTFFFERARANTQVLDTLPLLGVDWQPPVTEAPVTSVLWFVTERNNGLWLTHTSNSREAAIYGPRVKSVTLAPNAVLWGKVLLRYAVDSDSTFYAAEATDTGKGFMGFTYNTEDPNAAEPYLTDGENKSVGGLSAYRLHEDVYEGNERVDVIYNDKASDLIITARSSREFTRAHLALEASWVKEVPTKPGWYTLEREPVELKITVGNEKITKLVSDAGSAFSVIASGTKIEIRAPLAKKPGNEYELFVMVRELRAETYDAALLDRLAEYYYATPAQEPAEIEVAAFITPENLTGFITLSDYQAPVDIYEYRLTAERGLTIGVLTGQAEDPAALAQAELIKRRDGEAVIQAITAGSR